MIIHKMTASFGLLQNKSLTLAPGLNIIEAPNEAGKSTWAAFLRAMLYGIDSSDRDKRGHLADKNRYLPWSGSPMEGTLICEADGRMLALERTTARNAAPMARFSARDERTGAELTYLTGANAGSVLTGVEEDVFVRSAFIRQTGMAVDQSPALERRIAALVSSGEEETSYSEAEARLRSWQNRRRHNKSGLLPQVEAEIRSTEETLSRLRDSHAGIAAARAELEERALRRTELEQECRLHEKRAQREKNIRLAAAQAELEGAKRLQASLQEELDRYGPAPGREALRALQESLARLQTLRANLRQAEEQRDAARMDSEQAVAALAEEGKRFGDRNPEEAWEQAKVDRQRCAAAEQRLHRRPTPLILLGGLALLAYAGTAAIYFLQIPVPVWLSLSISVALTALCGGVLLWWNRGRIRAIGETDEMLARYAVSDPDEILEQAAKFRAAVAAAKQRSDRVAGMDAAAARLKKEWTEAQDVLLEQVHVFAPAVSDLFGISAALSRALELREKRDAAGIRAEELEHRCSDLVAGGGALDGPEDPLPEPSLSRAEAEAQLRACTGRITELSALLARAEGEQTALGDPAVLAARHEAATLRGAALEQEYAAIALAQETLNAANQELQARFSPALNARAGEILQGLTGGRYTGVSVDRSFQTAVREEHAAVARSVLSLSQGTADQLYLAIRLAVCELVLPDDTAVPLVLDDALANFDDIRMGTALDYLVQAAQHRQILLFTCHSRERTYCSNNSSVRTIRAEDLIR